MKMRLFIFCLLLLCSFPGEGMAKKDTDKKASPVASKKAVSHEPATATPVAKNATQTPAQPAEAQGTIATNIKADKVEYDAEKQTAVFSSNVYVQRPDFELWADKMTVYLKKSTKPAGDSAVGGMEGGDIDKIVAERNVRMKREDKSGTSQKATYYADSEKIVFEGSPVLLSKDSRVSGETIIHHMQENRSEILRGANIIFKTQDNSDKQGGLPSFGPSKGKK